MTRSIDLDQCRVELTAVSERAAGGALPLQLKTLTDKHLAQLETLVEAMRMAGIQEDLVRHSVSEIVSSYERELVDALMRLSEETA